MLAIEKMRFKNFLSFGNTWTEINFNEIQTNVLLQGTNGAGKSSILDIICFSLYGKPFRKIVKSNLVNYKNRKDALVEIFFKINDTHYMVKRGINPSIFEIYENGVLIDQTPAMKDYQEFLENSILKMDFQSFTQIVILGKATYVAFLRLPLGDRRKFIEHVLNLSIFAEMNELNKSKLSELKNALTALNQDYMMQKQKVDMIKQHIKELKTEALRQKLEQERSVSSDILNINKEIEKLNQIKIEKQESLHVIEHDMNDLNVRLKKLMEYDGQLQYKMSSVDKKLKFFEANATCPVCETEISEQLKSEKIGLYSEKINRYNNTKVEVDKRLKNVLDITEDVTRKMEQNRNIMSDIKMIDHKIRDKGFDIERLNKKKDAIVSNKSDIIDKKNLELSSISDKLDGLCKKRLDLMESLEYYDMVSNILKDSGIKASIIRDYIPKITEIMNHYLSKLNLFVRFEINENFEETLYSRGINPMNYMAYSEGEKLRIDLAMLLTWRDICKAQNNMLVNFLIFDEVLDGSLDDEGVDNLVNIFKDLEYSGVKIIIISHSLNRWDNKFKEFWSVVKDGGYSVLKKSKV